MPNFPTPPEVASLARQYGPDETRSAAAVEHSYGDERGGIWMSLWTPRWTCPATRGKLILRVDLAIRRTLGACHARRRIGRVEAMGLRSPGLPGGRASGGARRR